MKKVAVAILGWNGRKYLEKYLPSVVTFSNYDWCEVVYIDNASTDDSVAYIQANFPTVKIVQNPTNAGFAGGYNTGLQQINAHYFVLLNQDVAVTENWLPPMLSLIESNPAIAAVQPKLRADLQKENFEYAGAAGGLVDYLGYAFCRGRIFEQLEKDEQQYETPVEIFWGSGACLFVSAKKYWEVGGLDEDFFAHQEEIDLCWRIINSGSLIYYCPTSMVYHLGGGSLPQGNPRKTYLNFRNNLFLLLKNLPLSKLWWILPFRMILDGVAAFQSVLKRKNLNDFNAILKAHLHFYFSFFSTIQKRKNPTKIGYQKLYKKSIIWQHFVLKKNKFTDL